MDRREQPSGQERKIPLQGNKTSNFQEGHAEPPRRWMCDNTNKFSSPRFRQILDNLSVKAFFFSVYQLKMWFFVGIFAILPWKENNVLRVDKWTYWLLSVWRTESGGIQTEKQSGVRLVDLVNPEEFRISQWVM